MYPCEILLLYRETFSLSKLQFFLDVEIQNGSWNQSWKINKKTREEQVFSIWKWNFELEIK